MFNEAQKSIVIQALEEKVKSVMRAKNSGRMPDFDAVYDKVLGDIRVVIEIVRASKAVSR